MTEEEKIFRGRMFNASDPELLKIKHEAQTVAITCFYQRIARIPIC